MQNLINELKDCLTQKLSPTHLDLTDESAAHAGHSGHQGGAHLTLHIVSTQFEGKLPLARHRMIYEILAPWMETKIHALSIQAQTPSEYISLRSKT